MTDNVPFNRRCEQVQRWLLGWLENRLKITATPSTPLFNGVLDSLGLLEMMASCYEAFAVSLPLDRLKLVDLETVGSFAAAAARVGDFGEPRVWYEFNWPDLASSRRMELMLKLRAQLPSDLVVLIGDGKENFKVGVLCSFPRDVNRVWSLIQRCLTM